MRPVEDHDLKTKKAKYIHSLIEEAKSGVAGASEDTPDFYSQWLQGDVKKHLAFMSLARRDGDMNGIRKQAELAQEAYVAKAASLYRALDDAVVRTERLIASNEYYHAELTVITPNSPMKSSSPFPKSPWTTFLSSLEPMRAASRYASTLPKPLTLSSSACSEREDHKSRW